MIHSIKARDIRACSGCGADNHDEAAPCRKRCGREL